MCVFLCLFCFSFLLRLFIKSCPKIFARYFVSLLAFATPYVCNPNTKVPIWHIRAEGTPQFSIFNSQFSIPKSLYPTCEPLGTLSVGASRVSLPVASADIRIIPCEVIPLSSRGRRFTSTKIWRPTSSSGV